MNPWHELGLDESATEDQIRRAYRRLAADNHPDRHPDDANAAARFQRIRDAYDMLKRQPKTEPLTDWQGPFVDPPSGAWQAPEYDPFGQDAGSGVQVRFVAPEQVRILLQRLRKVLLLAVITGTTTLTALGHLIRGLPMSELMWPHQIIVSLGMGLGVAVASFLAWLFAVFVLGFRWGTVTFWMLVIIQVSR